MAAGCLHRKKKRLKEKNERNGMKCNKAGKPTPEVRAPLTVSSCAGVIRSDSECRSLLLPFIPQMTDESSAAIVFFSSSAPLPSLHTQVCADGMYSTSSQEERNTG